MPINSDYGVYSSPSSYVSSLYLPYSNHSSIVAANFRPQSYSKLSPSRPFSRGYKPHLATISESQSLNPLRRPYLLPSSSFAAPRPIKINTADIDVSVNKYRKYDKLNSRNKPSSPIEIEKDTSSNCKKNNLSPVQSPRSRSSSPANNVSVSVSLPSPKTSPQSSLKEPSNDDFKSPIRRDRALVRLHTVHRKDSPKRSWRENFVPCELNTEYARKTAEEEEKEKAKENEEPKRSPRPYKRSLSRENPPVVETLGYNREKSPSFHDICESITQDSIDEELNPGQPVEIQRKQSRQFTEEMFEEIRRNSADVLKENVIALEEMLQKENLADERPASVKKKKKVLKKKSNEKLNLSISDSEDNAQPVLQRRPTKKYTRTSSGKQDLTDSAQVEVEEIKIKPKPVITASVEVEDPKPNLKIVVEDDVEIVETPKQKKRFKFNVTVEVPEINNNEPAKKREKLKVLENGVSPKGKTALVSKIHQKQNKGQLGKIMEDKEASVKKKVVEDHIPSKIEVNKLKKTQSDGVLNNDKKVVIAKTNSGSELASKGSAAAKTTPVLAKKIENVSNNKVEHDSDKNVIENESNLPQGLAPKEQNMSTENFWAKLGKCESSSDLTRNRNAYIIPDRTMGHHNDLLKKSESAKSITEDRIKEKIDLKKSDSAKSITDEKIKEKIDLKKSDSSKSILAGKTIEKLDLKTSDSAKTTTEDIEKEKIDVKKSDSAKSITDEKIKEKLDLKKSVSSKSILAGKIIEKLDLKTSDSAKSITEDIEKEKIDLKKSDSAKSITDEKIKEKIDLKKSDSSKSILAGKTKEKLDLQKSDSAKSITKDIEKEKMDLKKSDSAKCITEDKNKEKIDLNKLDSAKSILEEKIKKTIDLKKSDSASSVTKVIEDKPKGILKSKSGDLKKSEPYLSKKIEEQISVTDDIKSTQTAKEKLLEAAITKADDVGKKEKNDDVEKIELKKTEKKVTILASLEKSDSSSKIDERTGKEKAKLGKDTKIKKTKTEPVAEATLEDLTKQQNDNARIAEDNIRDNVEMSNDQKEELIKNVKSHKESIKVENDGNEETILMEGRVISKRSLILKAKVVDPEMAVFIVPEDPSSPQKAGSEPAFVPLQSNRLSGFMNPFKKPEQYDECPVEIFATPKTIRGRHYPRPRLPQPPKADNSSEEETDSTAEEEEVESDDNAISAKVGASTSSNDSGFDSSVPSHSQNECGVNCHKKCEKLTANLCGVNQKVIVEAIQSLKRSPGLSSEPRDSPTANPAHNPAYAVDPFDEEYHLSSTFTSFQKSGRITPPATTIPRFRKYTIEDFHFLKVLGKGSFGKVLLAELKDTEYYYAVKCLKKDVVLEDDDVECTLIERKVLALGTKHPYLCHLLCTFQTESHLFFVMEYLNGGDLMWHIQASGRFPEPRARFYGAEIVSGLNFLHTKGIVYRDLKLDNILLDFDGHVRIADFGMCKLQIFLDRTADTFCGTPDYMAPEIIKGQHYNQCVDWWSFGVLLYEMLIGQSPFSGCDEDQLFWSICNEKPAFPKFLTFEAISILTLLLEKDASKRLGNRNCSAGKIVDQPFFQPIDWESLEERMLEPPFKPKLSHPLDTQYFDKHFTLERAKLSPIEKNILQSMDQTQFQGFSYTNPNATDR